MLTGCIRGCIFTRSKSFGEIPRAPRPKEVLGHPENDVQILHKDQGQGRGWGGYGGGGGVIATTTSGCSSTVVGQSATTWSRGCC